MELMKNYSDLLTEIELTKDQLKYTKYEFKWWSGIDMDTGEGIPLNGIGSHKHGTETAMIQIDKKQKAVNKLEKRLNDLETYKKHMDDHINSFKGLEYQIAYKKHVEFKTLQEIADDLGYSLVYIKKKSASMRSEKSQQMAK